MNSDRSESDRPFPNRGVYRAAVVDHNAKVINALEELVKRTFMKLPDDVDKRSIEWALAEMAFITYDDEMSCKPIVDKEDNEGVFELLSEIADVLYDQATELLNRDSQLSLCSKRFHAAAKEGSTATG